MSEEARAAEAHAGHERAVAAAESPLVPLGNDLLKATALVNGGAAFATLLLLCTTVRDRRELAFLLIAPLAIFGFGATVAAFATGFTYLAQSRRASALALRDRIAAPPFVVETEASRAAGRDADRHLRSGTVAVAVAMVAAILGFLLSGIILIVSLR